MLGKAFRPWRQLPDQPFAGVAASLCVSCNWGEIGADRARSLDDTLRCVVRTAHALCFRRVWPCANIAVAFFLWRLPHKDTVASAFPFGEGGTDRRSVTDEAANEDARTNLTMEAAA